LQFYDSEYFINYPFIMKSAFSIFIRHGWFFSLCGTAIFLTVFLIFLVPGSRARVTEAEDLRMPVPVAILHRSDSYETTHRYLGQVEAARSSQLGFELPGTVLRLHVREGDEVEAGSVLAELDTRLLEARRLELAAARREAQAAYDLAHANFQRTEQLNDRGVTTGEERDTSRQRREGTAAVLAAIDARLEGVEIDLANSQIPAPYAGTIHRRLVDEGTVVTPGMPLLEILETGDLEIRAGLSPAAAGLLPPGTWLELHTADDTAFHARVLRVLPAVDPETRTIDVILKPEGVRLNSGDLVEVPVKRTVSASGVWVPRESLTESNRGMWALYIIDPETRKLETRQVQILHATANAVFVDGALKDGEKTAAGGLQKLVPGLEVAEVNPSSASANTQQTHP
jgi:membrane fusion protein, multidrug efflux system